jgi:3'-phosphoadenosine 5'-phosphosulfate synthase
VWRKTARELMAEFQQKGADTVYAFQTRNPTHSGHAYLMRSAGEDLKKKGFKKPVLWLSPLGGWTKSDDVPLDVRVNQHEEVLKAGTSHPGGLDPNSTVMAIWPSPMVYAGPTEVQFHAKSRRSAGASYFVVGRDPAGMKGSMEAVAHRDDDLYDGNHGRYVLQNSPGVGDMQMLTFVKVMYDITDNVMKVPDESRLQDFISISGSKMRLLARNGAAPCSSTNIPTDLVEANCVPPGFMVPNGWSKVVDYYRNIDDTERWTPWSKPVVAAPADSRTRQKGKFGSKTFQLTSADYESFWHDAPLHGSDSSDEFVISMVTEIPMYYTAKMEIQKEMKGNPISQDHNKDGSPRYYTYGTPFFNYGLIPQTWEDPDLKSAQGYGGDNDPVDVIELGSKPMTMGSIKPCRVLGSFELIDEGETDHKILCISLDDKDAGLIRSLDDLERVKPGHLDQLRDWLKRYKTSDGKGENNLASDTPRNASEAMAVIKETHGRWKAMCGKDGSTSFYSSHTANFWLTSPGCRG